MCRLLLASTEEVQMARRPTGQLYVVTTKGGGRSYGCRFRWRSKRYYRTLGHTADG
jgi:hypothetical protein